MSPDSESKRGGPGWSLRWNVVAGYASQLYSTFIGIIMVPVYLRYMGTEAYGLIGFFAVVQLCIQSLDLGITPTLSREAARSRSGATSMLLMRQLLRSFEYIFLLLGALILLASFSGSGAIASHWLNGSHLQPSSIALSLVLMAAIAWLRWFAGLYRGVIAGLQKQVWQSGVNVAISTAHSVMVVPYLAYVGSTPVHFFAYQLAISIVELAIFGLKSYRLLPLEDESRRIGFDVTAIRRVFRFSLAIAITTGLWVAVSQFDKIVLSRMLSLSGFGVFSIATVVAGGVTTLAMPLRTALMPRLTELTARQDHQRMLAVYRNATQFTSVLAFSSALFLGCFAERVLWVWTGNEVIARDASATLALYALGNGIAAFGAFPYYLQYARGEIALHVLGTVLFLGALVPSVLVLTSRYGAVGAGCAWLGVNLAFLLAWVPYVHRRFLGAFHLDWIARDIASIASVTALVALAARRYVRWPESRLAAGAELVGIAALLVIVATAASPFARRAVVAAVARLRSAGAGGAA